MKTNTITAGAVLRLTQESDIALLPAIERSAARAFRQIPSLAWLADSEVISVARHHDYLETEHSLLAVAAGQPVGFILTEPLDDALFIVEVAVHQAWQQQGIGRMLLERVIERTADGLPGGNPHHLPRGAVECAVLYPSGIRHAR